MKKRASKPSFWMVLLLLLVGIVAPNRLALAKESQPDIPSATALLPANATWFTQYLKRGLGNVGEYNSIAFNPNNHKPYIAYYDGANQDLMLASPVEPGEGNCGMENDWSCLPVDGDGLDGRSSDDVGNYSSIAFWKSSNLINRWKLGISYYDQTKYSLRYAVYSCLLVTCEWSIVDIETGSSYTGIGMYTSLQYDSGGNPHIAYYAANYIVPDADSVRYATYVGSSGGDCGPDNDWTCDIVEAGTGVGKYAALDLTYDDQVYIAYYDESAGDLKYAYYSGIGNCGSGNVWYCTTIDGSGSDVGINASLAAPQAAGGPIRVAYYDKTNHQLRYSYSGLGTGEGNCGPSGTWRCNMIDSMSVLALGGISMQLDQDGKPFIAYQYLEGNPQAHASLRIARPYTVYQDGGFGNCGEVPPGELFLYWRCTTIDGAGAETYEASYVSLALGPGNLAAISYSETDDYYLTTSLKLAYQRYLIYMPLTLR